MRAPCLFRENPGSPSFVGAGVVHVSFADWLHGPRTCLRSVRILTHCSASRRGEVSSRRCNDLRTGRAIIGVRQNANGLEKAITGLRWARDDGSAVASRAAKRALEVRAHYLLSVAR